MRKNKKRGVLILHHIEPYWNASLREEFSSFSDLVSLAIYHLKTYRYDRVILTHYAAISLPDDYSGIAHYITDEFQYGFGWAPALGKAGQEFINGTFGSDWVLIDNWMRTLPKTDVYIAGCFDGQCVADLECALRHLQVDYKRVERLIV